MRSASSYRSARKKAAREHGVSLQTYNSAFDKAATAAEANSQAARERLGIWARNGGRESAASPPITPEALKAMNDITALEDMSTVLNAGAGSRPTSGVAIAMIQSNEQEIARKIKIEDIDKAMENRLSQWQAQGETTPLPLSKLFAARARQLGWIEGVEFEEQS